MLFLISRMTFLCCTAKLRKINLYTSSGQAYRSSSKCSNNANSIITGNEKGQRKTHCSVQNTQGNSFK